MGNVIISPEPHFQFLDTAGNPLSNGFIFTYDAGTSNLRSTYADSSGLIPNPNPIPLDATGSPSNGSVQVGIWIANQAYKFVAFNSAMVQQWSSDNISGYFGLLNMANVWTFGQTFSLPITITAIDNQIVTGAPGVQTTLDYPPPAGNVTLHFPNTADTMVGRATTDTLTNKTLTNPTINGVGLTSPLNLSVVLFKNGTAQSHTGDTSEDTIYSVAIPALSATSHIRVLMGVTIGVQGAGNSILRTKIAGTTVANHSITAGTWAADNSVQVWVTNRGATNSQITTSQHIAFSGNLVDGNKSTTAVDTSISTTMTITIQNANNGDSQTFEWITVEELP